MNSHEEQTCVEPTEPLPHFLKHAEWERFGPRVTVFRRGELSYVRVLGYNRKALCPSWHRIGYRKHEDARDSAKLQAELFGPEDASNG